jgi:SAM-dependent methyltransferase
MERLREYYDQRAPEFEGFYDKELGPAARQEVEGFVNPMLDALEGRRVLEVACGTGYWTARLARVARAVVATDASDQMLARARAKGLPTEKVRFVRADAYELGAAPGSFDGALAMFWLSHVPKARLEAFLEGLHAKLQPGAKVFMGDGVWVGNRGGLVSRPGTPDTFQSRTLKDGSVHSVLKNHYDAHGLCKLLSPFSDSLEVSVGPEGFWWVSYEVRRRNRLVDRGRDG